MTTPTIPLSAAETERPCPNCGVTLNGHYGLRYLGMTVTHSHADCIRHLNRAKEAAEAKASEALNQLDSARHSEECLKKRCEELWAEAAALREAVQSAETATATGDGLTPDETIRLHQMLHSALNQPKEGGSDG